MAITLGSNDVVTTDLICGSSTSLSVSLWYKQPNTTGLVYAGVLGDTDYATTSPSIVVHYGWALVISGATVTVTTGDGVTVNSTGSYTAPVTNDTLWHHIVVTITGTTVKVYADGVSKTVTVGTSQGVMRAGGARMGSSEDLIFLGTSGTAGIFDDYRIYNRALSANEAQDIFGARGHDAIVSSLGRRHIFNEKPAGTAQGFASNVFKDLTGFDDAGAYKFSAAGPIYAESQLMFGRRAA